MDIIFSAIKLFLQLFPLVASGVSEFNLYYVFKLTFFIFFRMITE